METIVIEWDGRDMPTEMRELPPGRYVIEPLPENVSLTSEEDAGIRAAIDSLDAGGGTPLDEALRRLRARLATE